MLREEDLTVWMLCRPSRRSTRSKGGISSEEEVDLATRVSDSTTSHQNVSMADLSTVAEEQESRVQVDIPHIMIDPIHNVTRQRLIRYIIGTWIIMPPATQWGEINWNYSVRLFVCRLQAM